MIIDLPFLGFFQGKWEVKWEGYFIAETLRGIASSTLGFGIYSKFEVEVESDETRYSSKSILYKMNESFDEILLCDYSLN